MGTAHRPQSRPGKGKGASGTATQNEVAKGPGWGGEGTGGGQASGLCSFLFYWGLERPWASHPMAMPQFPSCISAACYLFARGGHKFGTNVSNSGPFQGLFWDTGTQAETRAGPRKGRLGCGCQHSVPTKENGPQHGLQGMRNSNLPLERSAFGYRTLCLGPFLGSVHQCMLVSTLLIPFQIPTYFSAKIPSKLQLLMILLECGPLKLAGPELNQLGTFFPV